MIKSILTISSLAFLISCGYPEPEEGEKSSGSLDYIENNHGEKIIDTMANVSNAGAYDSASSSANHSTSRSYKDKEHKTEVVDHPK